MYHIFGPNGLLPANQSVNATVEVKQSQLEPVGKKITGTVTAIPNSNQTVTRWEFNPQNNNLNLDLRDQIEVTCVNTAVGKPVSMVVDIVAVISNQSYVAY